MLLRLIAISGWFAICATSLHAASKQEALYEVVLDMNLNGVPDRAVYMLVGPGRKISDDPPADYYILSDEERIDLAIYLDVGMQAVDLSAIPSILKADIFNGSPTGWIYAPSAIGKGSLKLEAAYWPGSSHNYVESLIIVYRNGRFLVGGMEMDWETQNYIGSCQFNFLTGKAFRQDELDGRKIPLKGNFKAVPLAKWSGKTRPHMCDK